MFGDLFLKVTRIICLIKQDLNLWNRNIEWDLITAILWASVTSSRSNIGITGLPSRYIDTQTSSSDILTKGNFTRDDWNSILHLFNISHFSSTWCAKNSSLTSCSKTMAKRMQEQKVEERSVAKSISTAMNLSSHVPASSSSAKGPIASKSLGYSELQGNLKAGQEEIRHPTQRRFLKGCWKMHSLAGWWTEQGRKLPKQTKVRNHGIFLNLNPEAILRKWRRNLLQEAGNGHIISICLQQSYLIWIESVRSYERFMVEVQRMTWMTSTWTPLYGVYSWTSHLRQHFILVETMCRIYDPPRINSSKACEKVIPSDGNIEDQREVNKLTTIITKSLRGDRRVYNVRKVLRLRMPQPTSSPTQCSVWGTWVIDQSNLGRTKFNGIWNIAMSKIWIESMESRWSSSGKYSQDSQRWASSKRLRNIWQKYIVNLSISKTGSSSCQCTTTLYGENKETQKSLRKISYSCELCSQIPARTLVISGTLIREDMVRNSLWTGLLNKWCSIFAESRHPFFFVPPAPWKEENYDAKERERSLFTTTVVKKTLNWFFARLFLQISSVYGVVPDLCKELSKDCRASGQLDANEYLETVNMPTEILVADPHTDAELQGNLLQEYERKFEQLLGKPEIIQTVLRCWFEDCWKKTNLRHTWRRRTKWNEESLPRVYIASMSKSIPCGRVGSRKHEDRPSLGCEGLSSTRTLRYWNLDRISVSRREQLLGFESWTELTNLSLERQKPFPLKMLSTELQGNLSQKQDHDRSLVSHCLLFLFLLMKENG